MSEGFDKLKAVVDMSSMGEDARIKYTGNFVMQNRQSAWMLTDDEKDKPERYRRKMAKWFPLLKLGEIKRAFPSKGCAGFTVHPPEQN